MKNSFKSIIFQILVLTCTFLAIESVFYFHSGSFPSALTILRVVLFELSFASIFIGLVQFKYNKITKVLLTLLPLIFAIYAIAQMGFIIFLGNYVSFKTAGQAGKITEYVIEFIKFLKPSMYLALVPVLFYGVYQFKTKSEITFNLKNILLTFMISLLTYAGAIATIAYAPNQGTIHLMNTYKNPTIIETALKEFGTQRFVLRDIITLFIEPEEEDLTIEVITPDPTPEPQETQNPEIDFTRTFDDSAWISAKENETNETVKQLDEYFLSKKIIDKNEMTGIFEGKNLIYIMIEAFDYIAIDPVLTPTIYKMQQEGWDFNNYFTPKYSCTTGESEFISLTSLVPSSAVCTPNSYSKNSFTESILSIFQNNGYYVSAYHNWEDEFYDRRELYQNMGVNDYYNIDQMDFKIIQGWQSDDELMKQAIPHFINEDKFMAHIVTSSMHFPYDMNSTLGNRYMEQINEVHPDYHINIKRYLSKCMELDKGLNTLLTSLEEAGKLEDTVIVMFADHHPLKTTLDTLTEYTTQFDRSYGLNEDKTPLIIYNAGTESKDIETVSSTFDVLPTVANLFNLNYDPRLYVGTDIFSNEENTVIFTNGDWISTYGWYDASEGTFTNFDDSNPASENWVQNQNKKVINSTNISLMIYKTDYFKKRDWISNPVIIK
ncbi:MAG: LTA synthase family protein [Erysipelotrichaceae bacterium]|nr:LTA synthase family protein [Erysipelotrichaceae bacterium]